MKPILLVNACLIGDNNGTGNTLASVFKSVDKACVYELCIDFLRAAEGNTHRFFVDRGFSYARYLLAQRRGKSNQSDNAVKHRANISGARSVGVKAIVHEIFRGVADILPVHISSAMCRYIEAVKPGYVYTCASSITSLRISHKIAAKYNIPLVLHIMDNWEETLYSSSVFSKPFSLILKHELKKANKFSCKNLAVSESLCKKFSEKYSKEYRSLMNTVDFVAEKPICFDRNKLIFLYAGSLSINRYVSLKDVANALHCTLGQEGYLFKLFVPSAQNSDEIQSLFAKYSVEIKDYIPRNELMKEYNNADVLVIAESFDENFCDFTKYSLSTKLPEYMASGKPILAYLSKNLYSSEYLIKSGAAAVACSGEELNKCVLKLKSIETRRKLAQNGLKFVCDNNSREYCDKILSEIFNDD